MYAKPFNEFIAMRYTHPRPFIKAEVFNPDLSFSRSYFFDRKRQMDISERRGENRAEISWLETGEEEVAKKTWEPKRNPPAPT